jgi:K+-sensing histidine kinase KdpD
VRTEAEIDAIRRRVINVVGHALRTPITTLCGMALELARQATNDDELARADSPGTREVLADGVRRNARIVERLLDDLLVASDVATALPVDEVVAVDLGTAAERVWATLGDPRPLVVEGPTALALAQAAAVDNALTKLLDNALRYGQDEVELRLGARDGYVRADVVSGGGALPTEEELPLSIEPFYRGEHAVMAAAGLGIGLTVARALAEQAGGSVAIRVESDRFIATIELPAR